LLGCLFFDVFDVDLQPSIFLYGFADSFET
jgi:hypothetical protein